MIVYDKEQKQIVIPNGLGNVNIVINQGGGECPECPECPECGDANIYEASMVNDLLMDGKISYGNVYLFKGEITEIQRIRPDMGDARYTLDGSLNVYNGQTMGYDIQVGDNVIVYGTLSEYNGAPQLSAGSEIKALWRDGDSCILEDKWVTPSMGERDDNGYIVVEESEGYDGLSRVVIDPTTIYKEGIEEGRNQGGGSGEGGGCTLTTRTITQNGTYRANEGFDLGMIDFSQNGAFDSLLKVSENTTIEFYFAFKEERPDLMSFFGCEDSDWQDTTFAARYYSGGIEVKIGTFVRNFNVDEYELANDMVHKMKVGKNYGISIDDRMLVTHQDILNEGITFEPSSTRTIYIGAINSPDVDGDNGLNLFWRPFNGYIGPVTIVGLNKNDEEVKYNYEPGDFGWWGEYRIIQTGQRIENIYREPGATPLEWRRYYQNADGFSEVTVDLRMETRDIRMDSKRRIEAAEWYGLAGFSEVNIDATDLYNGAADEGRRFIINSLEELNVSENGTYEAPGIYDEYKETHKYVENTGTFVTDFTPQLNDSAVNNGGFEIEVQAKVNSSEGGEKFIVGCAAERQWENAGTGTVINNVVLRANVDATSLFMSGCKTYNMPTINDEWVTYRITENGLDYKRELAQEWEHLDWEGDTKPRDVWNNKGNDNRIAIGGLNTFYDGLFNDFQGSIRYVRIKQGDYNKIWFPEGGQMRAEGTDDILDVQNGEAPEFIMDAFKTGSQGWKKVTVNVPNTLENIEKRPISIDDYDALESYDPNVIYLIY